MGVHLGELIGSAEIDDLVPSVNEDSGALPVERLFPGRPDETSTASRANSDESLREKPALKLVACPLGDKGEQIGMYNPQALAGRALSLTAALSPDYMQTYLSGLEDLMALKRLPETTGRRR